MTTDAAPGSLAVVILTFNEERHIARAIASMRPIASEIFVIDSFSTDRTVEIAQSLGATVLSNRFVNYARQFAWGLANAPITAAWTCRLDADEYFEPDLQAEVARALPAFGADVVGVNLDRKHVFMGRWVRHGGRYPLRLLRIWRTGRGHVEDRWMDEHVIVSGGRTVRLRGGFVDENMNDLTFFTAKHNSYATREAIDILNQRLHFQPREAMAAEDTSVQAAAKRWMKERFYNRLPFQLSALLYFLFRYIGQLGFLDGRTGTIYHVLQGFWYRFLVGAKTIELERAIAGQTDPTEIRATLTRVTGFRIE